jgi:nucleotide-binding universal stress UspA family protein
VTAPPEHGGTILCAVDPAAVSDHAVRLAAALHARLGMRLILLHVLPARPREPAAEPARSDAQQRLRAALTARADAIGGQIDVRVEAGVRPDVIARVAGEEGADMIVVGSSTGRRRTVRCGLAQELQAITPVPVLVAPPADRIPSGVRLALGLRGV